MRNWNEMRYFRYLRGEGLLPWLWSECCSRSLDETSGGVDLRRRGGAVSLIDDFGFPMSLCCRLGWRGPSRGLLSRCLHGVHGGEGIRTWGMMFGFLHRRIGDCG